NVALSRRQDRHLASGDQTRQTISFWPVRRLRDLWPSRQSRLVFHYLPAICASGGLEDDVGIGLGTRSDEGDGGVRRRSSQRGRTGALPSREIREWKLFPGWPSGIARALWIEPIERAPSPPPRGVSKKGRGGRTTALGLGNSCRGDVDRLQRPFSLSAH